jgi:spore coat protein A
LPAAACALLVGFCLAVTPAQAITVVLTPDQDNMMLEENSSGSNGSGNHFCAGGNADSNYRRSLLRFDLSPIPVGATITSVTLDLAVTNAAVSSAGIFDLHRVTAAWGESSSSAGSGECMGAPAEPGDATWLHRQYDTTFWGSPGGDFTIAPSASLWIDQVFGHVLWTSVGLTSDVQNWLDNVNPNHGWLLKRSSEVGSNTALRFGSRSNPVADQRPSLVVTYNAPVGDGACCTPGEVCQIASAVDCATLGGNFLGVGTDCSNPCPPDPTGACCAADASCTELTALACGAAGGSYQGNGLSCAAAACPLFLEPYVDALPIPATAQPVSGTAGGAAHYEISMREVQQQLHRDLPPTTVWGYGDGPSGATFPGPTIEAAANVPLTVDWINDIRDTSAAGSPKPLRTDHILDVAGTEPPPACHIHGAQDAAKTVVHLHGAHVEAAFDGYPEFTFLPGNNDVYTYSNKQLPALLWYHDHALGITRLNLYMGLAGAYIIRDDFEQGLGLPAGEYEVPLIIQDRTFAVDGSLRYATDWVEHYFGHKILVNGKVWPYHDVKQGKYRFRVLNGSGSRTLTLSLDRLDLPGSADVPMTLIGTDGGLREAALVIDEITLGPAERADIVIDFEAMPPGTEILLQNSAPAPFPGAPGVGVVPEVMKFVVQNQSGHTTALPMSLRALETLQETSSVMTRDFMLNKEPNPCGSRWTINDLGWDDVTEYPQLGTTEIWRFTNELNMMHPMHMHLVMFQLLDRQPLPFGPPVPPDPTEIGWKDTVQAPPGMATRVIARFEDYEGLFAYHCHIAEHEDHEMMRQFRTVDTIQIAVLPSSIWWTPQPGATEYDVVRGNLTNLVSSGGNFASTAVTKLCLGDNALAPPVTETATPNPGKGFWYLVRRVDGWGNGTYDTGRASQQDMRDDEIAASGNDCP